MAPSRPRRLFIILILGALTTISPLSIDMYLAAFPQIAADLNTSVARVSLSLSSYFIGLALGQLFYGPLLDRFGRKKPIYYGLSLYMLASIGCLYAGSVETLIALRFFQALGGCVAGVGSMSMVRDFFPVEESARIFSLLMLVLGVSPLLGPTIGSVIAVTLGWHWVFILLTLVVFVILGITHFCLPESHAPDPSISLKMRPIIGNFISIFFKPQFYTYALSSAFSFSGLLVYVSGSPIIFMDVFHVSPQVYGVIFALLSIGFIGSSQVNILISKKFKPEQIFKTALYVQCAICICFFVGTLYGWYGLNGTIFFFLAFLSCLGFICPNAAAIALAPFSKNIGSASALIGFLQIGIASLASACIGFFEAQTVAPIIAVLLGTTLIGLAVLLIGKKNLKESVEVSTVLSHPGI